MSELQKIFDSTVILQEMIVEQKKLVSGIVKHFSGIESDLTMLKNDMDYLKMDSEISTTQCKEITRRIKKKISEHLHHPSMDSVKYSRSYYQYIYKVLRSDYGLGNCTDTTAKRNYESVLKGIEEIYFPDGEIRERADILIEANLQLKSIINL